MTTNFGHLADYPRVPLSILPTVIEAAPRLSAELGLNLFIKRDDMTGLAFGGNKTRQLEFYFGAAQAMHADTILITGAVQSNYVRVAAAAAARMGWEIHIQSEERVPGMGEIYYQSGNVLLGDLLGAQRHSYPDGEDEAGADAAIKAIADDLRAQGKRPYVIPLGPGNPPLGALGYVLAAAEIVAQLQASASKMDAIVIASGSGFTHAGLLFGLRALGQNVDVYGICVRRNEAPQRQRIAGHCRDLAAMLEMKEVVSDQDIKLFDGVLAPGYGQMNPATADAIVLSARCEGLFLDPPYTGKTMAGLMALAANRTLAADSNVLFVHTGGTPGLFAYGPQLQHWIEP
ncbi:MAG: D-cysteine desulfhydrase family protein [Rhodospirillaceae bacterium]|jgi:D-cysteine desulfhydrase family pyridoxal phosphate-dependent enzyme|nr:D-cysteine desulfhydrase family protein [Rhodospirillaceae bacterium]MBT4044811.1 D-cysteine desulfhydrase family protein [Rhodospirillaceae bacterium]MBT4691316.1 D-cysteine desulfhydrase family protein [Rhodospirillaceae bacterium]MBT5081148.1 D-cysteine desulfhydrase family protein [Rhodospirillaceae bacterium]MBT5524675.1 D-cysteine desulfhydrase family protein [Rhodospirillaceae bacterium]